MPVGLDETLNTRVSREHYSLISFLIFIILDEITLKDKEIQTLKDAENKLKQELSKVKSSMKNKNVLDLEMEAYEKSLKDISQKLEDKNTQISEVTNL